MKFGIIAALDEELKLIKDQLQDVSEEKIAGITYYQGSYFGSMVVAACSSVGKVNAAICSTIILDRFEADCVINVGIAGAMDNRLEIMDIVFSSEAAFHDTDTVMVKYFPFKDSFTGDEELLELASKATALLENKRGNYYTGKVVSGDLFVSDRKVKDEIIEKHHPMCVEMEGAAVAQVAHTFNKPFLIIRTMSDSADENADNSYDNFLHVAAAQSAEIVLKMIESY